MPGRSRAMAISEQVMCSKAFDGRDLSAEVADNGEVVEERRGLDSQLWHACAGGMVQLPSIGSKVIYFPQGHAEQAASPPCFPPSLTASGGAVACKVLSVNFFADAETDEVYARIGLQPEQSWEETGDPSPRLVAEKPASFAKTLTQSDANNGGGFSVPRYCAETIFPGLDYSLDPPVQTVLAKDVHGEIWKFRHIYRGTPRRHLLTTGWSTFVNQKKLVAGDAIVFLRSDRGELCVGVRRSTRSGNRGMDASLSWQNACKPLHWPSRWGMINPGSNEDAKFELSAEGGIRGGIASSIVHSRARLAAKSVIEAATLAVAGQRFEVVYYPRASTAEFCVRAEAVRAALEQPWYPGMRFKMAFETQDSSRISWFLGNVSAVQPANPILWPHSPWRNLQVTWDEPDLLQGISRVSSWQVELASAMPMQPPPLPIPKKKLRVSQPQEIQDSQGYLESPMTTLAENISGQVNPWYSFSDDTPAGIQGARQERIFGQSPQENYPEKEFPTRILEVYSQDSIKKSFCPRSFNLEVSSVYDHNHFVIPKKHGNGVLIQKTSQNESNFSSISGRSGSSDSRKVPLVLFGTAIELVTPSTLEHSGSPSEAMSQQFLRDSLSPPQMTTTNFHLSEFQRDKLELVHLCLTKATDGLNRNHVAPQFNYFDSTSIDEIGSFKWSKEQASILTSEKKCVRGRADANSFVQCEIFMESEEVGRTIDLSLFNSYEELYEKLSDMFSTDNSKLSGRIIYKDLEGSTIHVGGEPYRNFMNSVKRLTILA